MLKWNAGLLMVLGLTIAGVWWYMESAIAPETAVVKRDAAWLKHILVDTPIRAFYKDIHGYFLIHLTAAEDFAEGITLLAQAGVSVNATCSLTDAEIEAHREQARYNNSPPDHVVWAY